MIRLRGKSIFIVEDNVRNRVVFQISLISHGAHVVFDQWGKDTLYQMAKAIEYDLIILDLMLPDGISGFDIFDEIRNVPRFNKVPIVAISAMDAAVAIPQAKAKGFDGFIAKPINKLTLPLHLANVIDGEPVWIADERQVI